MRTTPMLTLLLSVSLLAAPAPAAGQKSGGGEGRVVVVAVSGEGELGDRARAKANAALAGLGHRPESPEEAGLSEDALLACARSGDGCQEAFARSAAARVLVLRPEGDDAGLAITGWLFDGATGDELTADRRFCRPCDAPGELESAVGELVAALVRTDSALGRTETRLVVHTVPPGSRVEVNGRPLGPSGRPYVIAAGTAEVSIKKSGYKPVHRRLVLAEGQTEVLNLELAPLADGERDRPALVLRIAPWAALGAGAGATALGVRWIAIDGDRVGEGKRRATKVPGIVATASGAALIATSALLFWQVRGDSRTGVALVPKAEGAALAVGGAF